MSENVEPVEVPGVYFNHLSVTVQEAAGLATVHVVKEKGGFASATVRIADLLSAIGYEDAAESEPQTTTISEELAAHGGLIQPPSIIGDREPRVGDRVRVLSAGPFITPETWVGQVGVYEGDSNIASFPYRVRLEDGARPPLSRDEFEVLP